METLSQAISQINLLHLQGKLKDGERSRRIFALREQYEKKVDILTTK